MFRNWFEKLMNSWYLEHFQNCRSQLGLRWRMNTQTRSLDRESDFRLRISTSANRYEGQSKSKIHLEISFFSFTFPMYTHTHTNKCFSLVRWVNAFFYIIVVQFLSALLAFSWLYLLSKFADGRTTAYQIFYFRVRERERERALSSLNCCAASIVRTYMWDIM